MRRLNDNTLTILSWFDQVEIGSSWADQMEEGEAMYERDRPTQKVCYVNQSDSEHLCKESLSAPLQHLDPPLHQKAHWQSLI